MRLNLGACDDRRPGFINVDRWVPPQYRGDSGYYEWDLSVHPWPWPDSSIEEIFARDVFEHLQQKIATMNESYRVLQPGGHLRLIVPTVHGWGAFQDPTHLSFWTPNDLKYYTTGSPERIRFAQAYGITAAFRLVRPAEHYRVSDKIQGGDPNVWYLDALLEAVK